jgi:thiosulfate dehydrogenase
MGNASNSRRVGGAIVGTFSLSMAVLLTGCNSESTAPQVSAPVVQQSAVLDSTPTASDESSVPVAPADTEQAALAVAPTPAAPSADTVAIGACDGSGTVTVAQDLSGQTLADNLMDHWKRNHPEANWVDEEKERHALKPPADNSHLLKGDQGSGHPYGNYTELDLLTWARETEKFVAEGSRIFHSADDLGSSVAVSCDMCHPHAANTHPETYPKYQTQIGRVALLRDMIEWCIENPVRGEHLDPDSAKMRALEAYIMSQRKGVAMDYGKH